MVKNPHENCVIFQVIYMYHIQIQPPWTRYAIYIFFHYVYPGSELFFAIVGQTFFSLVGSDPDSLIPDPDPAFQVKHQSGSRVLTTKDWKTFIAGKNFLIFF